MPELSESGLRPPDARQGPGPIPGALLDALDVTLQRLIARTLSGSRRATGVGLGTELAQLRPYEAGDDVRHIDPAASARTATLHVRVHVPERALTTWIVLDLSPSMAFGTKGRLKADVAEGAALVFARLGLRRAGSVGVVACGVPGERGGIRVLPPRGSKPGLVAVRKLLEQGVAPDGRGDPDMLAAALGRVFKLSKLSGLVVVISDFRDQREWERPLGALRLRHAVVAVEVGDPAEAELPDIGRLAVVDPESGELVRVDSSNRRLRERFASLERERRAAVAGELRRLGVKHIALATDQDWLVEIGRRLGMNFADPLWLLLLALLPLALLAQRYARRRARSYAVRFPAASTLQQALAEGADRGVRAWLPTAALLLGLALLIGAIAAPRVNHRVPIRAASLMLVLDHSGSMAATDVAPTRLQAAARAANTFIDQLPSSARVGVVAFSTTPDAVQQPVTNHAEARTAIDNQQANGGTDTGPALELALQLLHGSRRNHPPAAIVLLSDGAANLGINPVVVAQLAHHDRIPIYTVALGTPDGTLNVGPFSQPIPVPPDPQLMRAIARSSGGRAYDAQSEQYLSSIYATLGRSLSTVNRKSDISVYFLIAAGLLLLGAALVSVRTTARLP